MRFVLGSSSPARLATLRAAGIEPEVIVSGVDESAITADTATELAQALATAKAIAVAQRIEGPALVLGCDSLLEFEGEALGKPGDADEATERWRRMRGRKGVLHTGHTLIERETAAAELATVSTIVHFADVSDDELAAYVATGEPDQVAGAFTIDGLGGWFVDMVEGDPHNVVGVSLPAVRRMVIELGYQLTDLGYPHRG